MPANDLPGVPLWKRRVLYGLATWTPLRWRPVREQAFVVEAWSRRVRRRWLERRGDWSQSQPALFGIDVRLGAMLGRGGTFVEAGGHDGHTQSNTYYLERALGWNGLLVEPMPNLARLARANRPAAEVFTAALTDPAGSGRPVRLHYAGLMSIVVGARGDAEADAAWMARSFVRGAVDNYVVEAPGWTLSEIIDEAGLGEIDLLSLDLEGYEPTALAGLDLDRHAPRWLLIEAHDDVAAARVAEMLGDRYVYDGRFSEMDDLFRRADVPALSGPA